MSYQASKMIKHSNKIKGSILKKLSPNISSRFSKAKITKRNCRRVIKEQEDGGILELPIKTRKKVVLI